MGVEAKQNKAGGVVVPLGTNISSRQLMYATESDWERHRNDITKLYSEQRKTLKDVMQIMEQDHHFLATKKMYKVRIQKWGLDKRLKAPEVLEMLRLKQRRHAVGKESEFFIRNRAVNWKDVDRYIKRHRGLVAKWESGFIEVGGNHDGVVVRTPSPDPVAMFSVPGIFQGPDNLRNTDDILRIMRDYCQGAIEEGLWTYDPQSLVYVGQHGQTSFKRLVWWLNSVIEAGWCIRDGRLQEGFQLANACLDKFQKIAKDQDFHLLFFFHELQAAHLSSEAGLPTPISGSGQAGLQGLKSEIQSYTAELLKIVLGRRHPLSLLWAKCYTGREEEQIQFQIKAVEAFLTYFTNMGRPLSQFPYIFRTYFRLLRCAHDKTGLLEYSRMLRDPLQAEWNPDDWGPVNPMLELATNLVRLKEFSEAEIVLKPFEQWLASKDPYDFQRLRYDYYSCLSRIKDGKGQNEEARQLRLEWLGFSEATFGRNHDFTLDILRVLIDKMEEAGEEEEAAKLKEDHDARHKAWLEEHC